MKKISLVCLLLIILLAGCVSVDDSVSDQDTDTTVGDQEADSEKRK